MGGPTYTYSNQNMYSQPQNSYAQITTYHRSRIHITQSQNVNMQRPSNQAAYSQEVLPQAPPPLKVNPRANGQPLMDPNMIAKAVKRHFGVQFRPLDRLIYMKLYLDSFAEGMQDSRFFYLF